MPYPDDETRPTDLREFFAVLRRRKWSVILPTLLVVGVALASVLCADGPVLLDRPRGGPPQDGGRHPAARRTAISS